VDMFGFGGRVRMILGRDIIRLGFRREGILWSDSCGIICGWYGGVNIGRVGKILLL
jgi:hypothetical protein